MISAIVSPEARRDLLDIADYIAADSPSVADGMLEEFDRAFGLLSDMPGAGHRRLDLTTLDLRFWSVRRTYLVVYRELTDAIEIVRVLDGRRDVAALLG